MCINLSNNETGYPIILLIHLYQDAARVLFHKKRLQKNNAGRKADVIYVIGNIYLLEPAFNPGCGAGGLLSPVSPSLE
jgi:hypothetical protein